MKYSTGLMDGKLLASRRWIKRQTEFYKGSATPMGPRKLQHL